MYPKITPYQDVQAAVNIEPGDAVLLVANSDTGAICLTKVADSSPDSRAADSFISGEFYNVEAVTERYDCPFTRNTTLIRIA